MQSIIHFETDRLYIDKIALSDVDSYFELFSLPEIAEFDEFEPITIQDAVTDVKRIRENYDKLVLDQVEIAVREKGNQLMIGVLYIQVEGQDCYIGYHFHPNYQGKGYAREAVLGLIGKLKEYKTDCIVKAKVDSENIKSIKLLEKSGFSRKMEYEIKQFFKGKSRVEWLYELL